MQYFDLFTIVRGKTTLELKRFPVSFLTTTLKFYKMSYRILVVFNQLSVKGFQRMNALFEIRTEIKDIINSSF